MVYEVVCTKGYLDVGLLIEKYKSKPKRVLSRASAYSSNPEPEYGGVETLKWVNTGVFLSKDEWKKISYNKGTNQILSELGIVKEEKDKDKRYIMTRLTERFSNGQAAVAGCGKNCKHNYEYCNHENGNCPTLSEIYEKLAFYEDLEANGELPIVYGENIYPCTNCGVGWASVSTNGCKSCHDDCEKLREYYRKEFDY